MIKSSKVIQVIEVTEEFDDKHVISFHSLDGKMVIQSFDIPKKQNKKETIIPEVIQCE